MTLEFNRRFELKPFVERFGSLTLDKMRYKKLICLSMTVLLFVSNAMYLPGVAPKDYVIGEEVQLKVNKLTSSKAELSYEYYRLPFCQPDVIKKSAENLGELLTGNRIENSPYDIKFLQNEECKLLCRKQYSYFQVTKFVSKIKENYLVNWIVDNLPSALRIPQDYSEDLEYYQGFPLGGTLVEAETDKVIEHFLNNHARIIIKYHVHEKTFMAKDRYDDFDNDWDNDILAARIVGLDVEPFSVRHKYEGKWDEQNPPVLSTCTNIRREMTKEYLLGLDGFDDEQLVKGDPSTRKKRLKNKIKNSLEVIWTYDVLWEYSSTKWATRWDVYLNPNAKQNDEVHWFAIVNSVLIVLFLTGMVAMIMMRTLHKDLSRYNRIPTEEERAEDREESGWKLVHGDVFRTPLFPMAFAVTIGTGSQVLGMTSFSILLSAIGFLSPANRGSLMLASLLIFVLMGVLAGYVAARVYKELDGTDWQKCTIATALFYPGIIFGILFLLNLVVWAEGSSNAIPFFSLVSVLLLWFGISVPLTFLGAFYGYKKDIVKAPVKVHDIPRQIPQQPWYMSPLLTVLMGGILPFGSVFVELFFIMSSIWLDQYYYVFGFLFLVFVILMITCAEITIVMCYFQLCGEDYLWHWRSLLTSGSSAAYLFGYSIVYFSTRLQIDLVVTALLYFAYMAIISILFFLATSVVGYFACNWFVRKIYGSVKVD